MTGSTNGPRVPGATLLKIARLLFSDHVMSAVVQPTIADLQREVAEAGPRGLKRLRTRWRGYRAFWAVAVVVPFASWPSAAPQAGAAALTEAARRLVVVSAVLSLLAAFGAALGAWIAVVMAAGALVAIALHAWYKRHPSDIPDPIERQWHPPQINFSSTDVAGNVGGLIFVVGSVLIVIVGLPSVFWFLLAGTIAGCGLAWALMAWHTSHPTWGLPENRIVWR